MTNALESFENNECIYIEYRNGLIRKLTELGAKTLPDENKKSTFIQSVLSSKDINKLILQTSLVKKLDMVDGVPKLLLTVYCKWIESYI